MILQLEATELTGPRPQVTPKLLVAVLVLLRLKRTEPDGVTGVDDVSVTKTVQVDGWLTVAEEGEQENTVTVE